MVGLITSGTPLAYPVCVSHFVDVTRERIDHSESLRMAMQGRCDCTLLKDMGRALKDDYERSGVKKARDWPHKKTEKPPGQPKIQSATAEQRRESKRLNAKRSAA